MSIFHRSKACVCVVATAVVLGGLDGSSSATTAEPVESAIGYEEYSRTGQFPRELWIPEGSGRAMLPTSRKRGVGYRLSSSIIPGGDPPGLTLDWRDSFGRVDDDDRTLQLELEQCHDTAVPIFGELYHLKVDYGRFVHLKRLPDVLPESLRPNPENRIISLAERETRVFVEVGPNPNRDVVFDVVEDLRIERDAAAFSLRPMNSGTAWAKQSNRRAMDVTVKAGEVLSARGREHRVLRVVSPQRVGTVDLVGWIEISAEPLPDLTKAPLDE